MTVTANKPPNDERSTKFKTCIAEQTGIAESYMTGYTVTFKEVSRRRLLASSFDWTVSYSVSSPASIAPQIDAILNSRTFQAAAAAKTKVTITSVVATVTIEFEPTQTTQRPTHQPNSRSGKYFHLEVSTHIVVIGGSILGALGAVFLLGLAIWLLRVERAKQVKVADEGGLVR
jgi:hypothetical protein